MNTTEIVETARQALDSGRFVIIDGKDSVDSSEKLGKAMSEMELISIDGVTSYGVVKGEGGKFYVTPLQSNVASDGERKFNQLNEVLGIHKPPT